MKRVGIIPFCIGCGSAEPLQKEQCEFYLSVAEAVTGARSVLVQSSPVPAIVVEAEPTNIRPSSISAPLSSALTNLRSKCEIIVVDMENLGLPYFKSRGSVDLNAFVTSLSVFDRRKQVQADDSIIELLIVLATEIPQAGNVIQRSLDQYIQSGQLVLIQDDGLLISKQGPPPSFHKEQYCLKLTQVRGKPIDLLQKRLVRQRGHFKREFKGQHTYCVDIYLDGKLCDKEIKQLVGDHLKNKYDVNKRPHILYYPTFSQWLGNPLSLLASELGLQCHSVDEILQEKRFVSDLKNTPPLLVVQVVDTGKTIAETVKLLNKYFSLNAVNCLAIISARGDEETFGTRDDVPDNITVSYLLRIARHRYTKSDNECPMCKLGIPYSKEGEEDHLMLGSYDFWKITEKAGLKPEDDPPPNRPPLKKVPDFPRVFHENGAWLATKIEALLKKASDKKPRDLVIVCPDQRGSQVLTEYLTFVTGVTVIRIAEEAIHKIRDGESLDSLVGKWEESKPPWYVQLCTAASTEFIVMDEFCLSAGTKKIIEKLLYHLKKDVVCFFTFTNFCPQLVEDSHIPVLSLYAWKMYQEAMPDEK